MICPRPTCTTCHVKGESYFSLISKEDQQELWVEKSTYVYKKNQLIFHENNHASGIYCLHTGKVKMFKTGFEGKEQIVRFIFPGEVFGIRSIIGAQRYQLNATALVDSVICFIPQSYFSYLFDKYPSISKKIIMALCNRLLDTENKLTSLAQKPVRERLAEALIYLSDHFYNTSNGTNSHVINLSREDLANIVGSATETIIRLLSEFKEAEIIEINGRKIKIIKKSKLEYISNAYS